MAKLPSFPSSLTGSFKVPWPWSRPSETTSRTGTQGSTGCQSSSTSSHGSHHGYYEREPYSPQASSPTGSNPTCSSFRRYGENSHGSQFTNPHRSDETYGRSFTISSRLRRAISAPSKIQTACGFIILVIVVVSLVAGLVVGLRNVSLQDKLRDRLNTTPVRIPHVDESVIGHIKGEPPQTREFHFVIDERLGRPDGYEKDMFVVNGRYPGPTIEVNQGDQVVVTVQNDLANATSIHWKGLFQLGTNYFDGVEGITECGIPPGENMTYRFKPDHFSGTTYWKAGYGAQASDGLTGGFVVHPIRSNISITYDEEIMIHLSDLYHETSSTLVSKYLSPEERNGKPGHEPVPDSGTINGIGQYPHAHNGEALHPLYYKMTVEPTKSYRLRLVNAGSFAPIKFSVDSHNLTVVEADGVEVEPITFTGGVVVEVGQRYSVILHADHEHGDKFWMRASLVVEQFKRGNPDADNEILGIVAYGEEAQGTPEKHSNDSTDNLDVTRLRALRPLAVPAPTLSYVLDYQLTQGEDGVTVGKIILTSSVPLNESTSLLPKLGEGKSRSSLPNIISIEEIEVVDLIIENLSGGAWPFSLNGHRPWLIDSGSGRYSGQAENHTTPSSTGAYKPNKKSDNSIISPVAPSPLHQSPHPTNPSSGRFRLPHKTPSSAPDTFSRMHQKPASEGQKATLSSYHSPNSSASWPHLNVQLSKNHPESHIHPAWRPTTQRQITPNPTTATLPATSFSSPSTALTPQQRIMYHAERAKAYRTNRKERLKRQSHGLRDDSRTPHSDLSQNYVPKFRRQVSSSTPGQILSASSMQRDTFTLPKDGWIRVRFVADNPGAWLLSDQTQWHLASGAAMQIVSQPAQWSQIPEEVQRFCHFSNSSSLPT